MCYIYALVDPRNSSIRYIGKSIDPIKRLKGHLNDKASTKKARWIKSLLKYGLKPEVVILELVDNDKWQEYERKWIAYYKSNLLTNHTDGGEGLSNPSLEVRVKLSNIQRIRMTDPSYRSKIYTKERSAKISKANKGRCKTPEHVAKLWQNKPGWKQSDEAKRKISASLTGKTHSEKTKRKMSLASLGNKRGIGNKSRTGQTQSAEERMKKSLATKGRPKSPEWKEKARIAALKRWQRERESNGKIFKRI